MKAKFELLSLRMCWVRRDENGWKCDEWKEIKKKRVKRECKVILFDWDERGYKIKDGIKEIKDLN